MKVRRMIAGATLAAATALSVLGAQPALAGGDCNPGDIDVNCDYKSTADGKVYDCTVWTGNDCIADLSGLLSVHMRVVSYQ